ncbi:hypothetical protein DERF_013049 [Dermatophagoides farinae]|uniref:Uncharacterized protein n=1 Tax=Dermatophagoides farinae TaxID=6954 RepID=A0A922HPC8_DERFA|nr:hypothetical protein DERF_013049 [Dermatophagoides farinae]
MYTRLIIFIEDYQKYFSKIFLIALIQAIVASQIIMNSLKFIQNDHHIVIMLYYFLFLDYVIIIILSFIVSIFNSFLNSIRYDLQRTVWLMNSSPSRFRSKFQMLMYYERLVKRSKPWGLKLGVITVMTTATFAKLIMAYARFTMLSTVSGLVLVTIIYDSFRTQKSLAFRTLIQYTRQDQQQQQQQQFSRSSSILMDYGCIKISSNFIFIHFTALIGEIFECYSDQTIKYIIIRMFTFHMNVIALNFLFTFIYCPIFIAFYLLSWGYKLSRRFEWDIENYSTILFFGTQWLPNKRIKTQLNMNMIQSYKMYTRLIIFVEELGKYFARILFFALALTIFASQIVLSQLRHLSVETYFTLLVLIYCLLLDYLIIILMTYSISVFNKQLNSIGSYLQRSINKTNRSSNLYLKFQLMLINERLIGRKPWGIRIGDLTVVTKSVFMKIIILYARFTLLSNKLS